MSREKAITLVSKVSGTKKKCLSGITSTKTPKTKQFRHLVNFSSHISFSAQYRDHPIRVLNKLHANSYYGHRKLKQSFCKEYIYLHIY